MCVIIAKYLYKCDESDTKRLTDLMKQNKDTYRSLSAKMGKGYSASHINKIFIGKRDFCLQTVRDFMKVGYNLIPELSGY